MYLFSHNNVRAIKTRLGQPVVGGAGQGPK